MTEERVRLEDQRADRKHPAQCEGCHHAISFHPEKGKCHALGCKCQGYVEPPAEVES